MRRLAGVVAAASVVLGIGGVILALMTPGPPLADAVLGLLAFIVPVGAFSGVGYVLATRLPGNRVGWLCLAIGGCFALVVAGSSLARWGLLTGALPQALCEWLSVVSNAWVVGLGLMGTQLPLRLPDGELPSPRWRPFSRLTLVLLAAGLVSVAATPGAVEGVPGTANPLGASWAGALSPLLLLLLFSFAGGIASLVLRYRHARPVERAQLQWIAFGGVFFLAVYFAGLLLDLLLPDDSLVLQLEQSLSQLSFALLPLAIGHAVLRRHLYDLGAVVSRTVVYTTLTVLLAAVYVGSVLLLQVLLRPFTEGSGLAVALSTLGVAALFRPARTAVQSVVDRRFYRSRYDARHTLDAFVTRLRDEIDLDAVRSDLTTTVSTALTPSAVSLWVPPR